MTGLDADITGSPLHDEVIAFKVFLKRPKNPTPLKILNLMKKFNIEDLY
jgi:hypothetical protein